MYPISKMLLYVTRDCNLECTYCFVDKSKRESLPLKTGTKAVDWLIHQVSGDERKLSLGFFGGEPLIVYDLVAQLMEYSSEESWRAEKEIDYSMTTNALLVNDKRLSFFSRFPFHMRVSIDGSERAHNLFRRKPGGQGSFDDVLENVPMILRYLPGTGARITVNPETVPTLGENIEFVQSLGFRTISLGFNTDVSWSMEDFVMLDRELRVAANKYLDLIMCNRPVKITLFDNALCNLISCTRPQAVCGAGKGYVSVGLKGDVYPCHHFVCMNGFSGGFRLGDIDKGIDTNLRLPFLRYAATKSLGCGTSCKECKANPICGGGCLAKGYKRTGLIQLPDPIEQKFNLILAEIASQIHQFLDEHRPPFYVNLCRELGQKETCGEDV